MSAARKLYTGVKLREIRTSLGMTQAEYAGTLRPRPGRPPRRNHQRKVSPAGAADCQVPAAAAAMSAQPS
jgi:hypothetical protein